MSGRLTWVAGLVCGLVLAGLPAAADTLALDEVLAQMDRRLPLLRAAEVERELARTDLLSAQGAFDIGWQTRTAGVPLGYYQQLRIDSVIEQPTTLWGTSVFAGYRLGAGSFADYDGKLVTNDLGEWRAGVKVPLWRNGPIDRRRANLARAEVGLSVADLTVLQQRLELSRTAAQRYWDWVAAGRRQQVVRKLYALAQRRDRDLGALVTAGQVAAIERVENARALAQRQAQVVAAERSLQQSTIELSLYVRDTAGAPVLTAPERLPGGFPEPVVLSAARLSQDLATAVGARPEARRFDMQKDQAGIELSWAQNQLAPGIDFTLAASQDVGAGSKTRLPTVLEATILLDVPLQTRVATGRADNAKALITRLEAQTEFARDRIRADVQDALSALDAARQRVAVARTELGLANKVEVAERTKFLLGDSTLFIVNLREQATADAAIREIDALLDFHRSLAAYRAAIGEDAAALAAAARD